MGARLVPDAAVLARARELSMVLGHLGLVDAADRVREAISLAGADPARASKVLAEAADLVAAQAPEARRP